MLNLLNIDTSQTTEKFLPFTNEILGFLVEKLQALNTLESEIFERSLLLKDPNAPHQVQPGEKELWAEYTLRHNEIVAPISVKAPEDRRPSFGKPTKYAYLNYPNTKIFFIMKSATRVIIETEYEYGIVKKHQFVLKKIVYNWNIDSKKYGFPSEDTWWKDRI